MSSRCIPTRSARDLWRGSMTALRVLHVDDEPDIREVVEFSLGLTRSCDAKLRIGRGSARCRRGMAPRRCSAGHDDAGDGRPRNARSFAQKSVHRHHSRRLYDARAESVSSIRFAGWVLWAIPKPFDPLTLAASARAHVEPPEDRLGEMRTRFLQRVDSDIVALVGHWSALEDGSAVSSSLAASGALLTDWRGLAGSLVLM